jgi:drug/metabolite transporter (DMT)-like permease
MNKIETERLGESLIICEVLVYALFPIVVNYTTKIMPPILFAGLSTIMAGVALFTYILIDKQLSKLKNIQALKYILAVTLFVIIIPSIFIFTGTSKTSGINTTILLQTEILFAFFICGIFVGEKITPQRIGGAVMVVIGAVAILYNGTFQINRGDLLIIAGTFFFPIGNIYAKKALELTTPAVILFVRSFLGGMILVFISLLSENYQVSLSGYAMDNFEFILLNGALIYGLSRLLWYEGLKRLDISKATSLAMSYPAFSLFYSYIFLKEIPTIYQWMGFIIIFFGVFILTYKRKKVILVGT